MRRKQKGFTLLEAVFAILLFALLVQMLMQFFFHMYVNSKFMKKQAMLMDNARTVNTFIKEKIREADTVEIYLEPNAKRDGVVIGDELLILPITQKEEIPSPEPGGIKKAYNKAVEDGKLSKIVCNKGTSDEFSIELKPTLPADDKKGDYTLYYIKSSVETPISNMIKEIKVERKANANEILFKSVYQTKVTENSERETVKDNFTETLAYKK